MQVEKSVRISKELSDRLEEVAKYRKSNDLSGNKVTEIIRECIKAHLPKIEAQK